LARHGPAPDRDRSGHGIAYFMNIFSRKYGVTLRLRNSAAAGLGVDHERLGYGSQL
jgi:hypothetical protein